MSTLWAFEQIEGTTDVHRQHDLGVFGGGQHRIPMVAIETRQVVGVRRLREADRGAPLGGDPVELLDAGIVVPERENAHRDDSAGVRASQFVDLPIVVGGNRHRRQFTVGHSCQPCTRKPGSGWEVDRSEHTVGIHVTNPLMDVVATGPHIGEADRVEAPFGTRP